MTKPYETSQMLTLSTAHIPTEERAAANVDAVYQNEYGWIFWCGDQPVETKVAAPNLRALKQAALNAGCQFLRLDSDGEVRDDLPNFEW